MHPTYTQRAADGPSHLRPCYVCSHVTSQRATTCNPTERLAGPLIHSKSCPSDSHYLPNLAFQQSSPPASQRRALPAPNRQTGRPSHSFEIRSQWWPSLAFQHRGPATIRIPTSHPSDRHLIYFISHSSDDPHLHLNVASQRLKKLALMAAHDSILAARVKQTRDANRKRQASPFSEGDLVYLSSKNIKFPKGLARKLIPKYLGPYKILKDFENYSFRVDLPSHLKQRGVHDVFHSSLLRIHHPNDDRLFPGRLDAQISHDVDPEGEWAVESILSHYGSEDNALFEIKWRSGDITWMPYFQILGLQALEAYFEALGINAISELSTGKGKPPRDDPQVFVGLVHFTSEPVSARGYNSSGSVISYPNSPPCLSSNPSVTSTSIMTKSSLPSFKPSENGLRARLGFSGRIWSIYGEIRKIL
jgi:hypothetical protein